MQAARGAAALLVLLYHCTVTIGQPRYAGVEPLVGLFRFGHAGVDFFFVLSGFIITYAHSADIGRKDAVARYAWRRLTRIYPAYWVALALTVALYIAMPGSGTSYSRDPRSIVMSALLMPQDHLPVLGVAWTLSHEMLFYSLFGLAILSRRPVAVLFLCWQGAVLAYATMASAKGIPPFLFYSVNAGFGVGVGVAALTVAKPVRHARVWALSGALAFFIVGLLENRTSIDVTEGNWPIWHFSYIVAAGTMLYGIVGMDMHSIRAPRWAVFLGAASYSIYLVHTLAVSASCKLLVAGLRLSANAAFPVVALGATTFGILFYLAVERPFDRWARSRRIALKAVRTV